MPIIDGEKWACNSCVKGHRVSGCTHTDRELIHINPKGRPVKQCEHCRGARKSKSHHAKCECGDKKDKLKDKGDAKGEHSPIATPDISNSPTGNGNGCCCHSGAKCICGIKKESLDLKLDTTKLSLHATRTKPKLTSTHSESILTVFANGHHKPCHRNNNAAHESGAPYRINRPHTLHGSAAFAGAGYSKPTRPLDGSSQRSVDTWSLSNNDLYATFGSTKRSGDFNPATSLAGSSDFSALTKSLFTPPSTTFSQNIISPMDGQLDANQQWPWTTPLTMDNRDYAYGSLTTSPSQECLPTPDDWAIPSAGLTNPLWSAGDLPLDPSKLDNSLAQPISHSGESNKQSIAGLTTASSSHSELEEPALLRDVDFSKPPSTSGGRLFWEDEPFNPSSISLPETPFVPSKAAAFTEGLLPVENFSLLPTPVNPGMSDKGTFFAATGPNEASAISMPVNYDDIFASNWAFDNTLFDTSFQTTNWNFS
ncbi:hypothetical protein M011DRAFT_397981 [Sporormia fimetaria CBS 119925]|uniref:Copper-fist domain-containing protein n=1 Tax=Sporormia fimetaria CBS 119925 TaxID=1340428 RepID=A0A6A6VK94_9PLEO|nr:hypothetical protein M011DRAFT_397981 [Sporormia fimetaria CBS 119925]